MSGPVDVIAVLDLFISAYVDGQIPESDQIAIHNARAAVAELIESIKMFRHELRKPVGTGEYTVARDRLDAAIYRMGGAA